jgi:hypothetical protein
MADACRCFAQITTLLWHTLAHESTSDFRLPTTSQGSLAAETARENLNDMAFSSRIDTRFQR